MADARALLEMSRALQQVLQEELSVLPIAPAQIRIESLDLLPDPVPPPRITIFLYNIHEDPYLRNSAPEITRHRLGVVAEVSPPLALELDYMICAWAATTDEELQLLGDILRVLSDHPDFEPGRLGPSCLPSEAVHLLLINTPIEEQARIWSAFGFRRFKLSLYYRARSVLIDSHRRNLATLVQTPELDARLLRAPGEVP